MDVEITSRIGLKFLSTPSSTALWVQAARLMPLLLTAQTLMVADGRPRTLLSVGALNKRGRHLAASEPEIKETRVLVAATCEQDITSKAAQAACVSPLTCIPDRFS
jgi:uncharacterized protein YqgV (UPF0045/DUF77 family)